ncbi:MAG TPA: Fe-S cluster assembly protein SufD [Ktedonobacterales bacterium]|nr:Fe-S cluster assembly protein SufD [Ktedonobacterales bacterium]
MTAPAARRGFTDEAAAELLARRDEPEWMRQRRRDAWKIYQELPMPARTDEEWRRTDLRNVKLEDVQPFGAEAATQQPEGSLLPDAERGEQMAGYLALYDGRPVEYRVDESTPRGVIFTDLATALREHPDLVEQYFMSVVPADDSKFAALHGAFWENGTFLYVPRNVTVELPFRSIVASALNGTASVSHTLIVLEENARAVYAEDFTSPEAARAGFSSRVVELVLKDGANLHYVGVQRWGRAVNDFHTERVVLGNNAEVVLQTVEFGSALSKGRVESVLRGNGASAKLLGLYVEEGRQHFDRYTLQDHIGQAGTSDLLFKGVLTDRSRSVFSGLIRVGPSGKQTAAYQQNRNLLLSRTARADSIPNLEIGCNDIIGCTHGATVGKVDEEELFYLQTRGLDRATATELIVEGFVAPVIAQVPIAPLQDALRDEIRRRIRGREAAVARH